MPLISTANIKASLAYHRCVTCSIYGKKPLGAQDEKKPHHYKTVRLCKKLAALKQALLDDDMKVAAFEAALAT